MCNTNSSSKDFDRDAGLLIFWEVYIKDCGSAKEIKFREIFGQCSQYFYVRDHFDKDVFSGPNRIANMTRFLIGAKKMFTPEQWEFLRKSSKSLPD